MSLSFIPPITLLYLSRRQFRLYLPCRYLRQLQPGIFAALIGIPQSALSYTSPKTRWGEVLGGGTCSIWLEYTARGAESGGGGDGVSPLSCSQAGLLV